MIPCTVSGTSTSVRSSRQEPPSRRKRPRSRSMRMYSSAKSGIAVGTPQERLLHLRGQNRLREVLRDQTRGVVVRERRERQSHGVRLAAAPPRAPHEQLRPRAAEDEQRHSGGAVDETVDEVEEPVVGPVQVLEHEDGRALLAERLEEAPPGGERLAAAVSSDAELGAEPDERPQVGRDPVCLRRDVEEGRDRLGELPLRLVGSVRLENAGLRLCHLAQRPVADPIAVGEAAALTPDDDVRVLVDDREQLGHDPALADPGDADERDELGRPRHVVPASGLRAEPRLLARGRRAKQAAPARRRFRIASEAQSPATPGPARSSPWPRTRPPSRTRSRAPVAR